MIYSTPSSTSNARLPFTTSPKIWPIGPADTRSKQQTHNNRPDQLNPINWGANTRLINLVCASLPSSIRMKVDSYLLAAEHAQHTGEPDGCDVRLFSTDLV